MSPRERGGRAGGGDDVAAGGSRGGAGRRALAAGGGLAALALALGLAGLAGLAGGTPQEEGFPHEEHAGLFPVCTGCHEGVATGDVSDFYPAAASCAGCHDGVEVERVDWTAPSRLPDNLDFAHPEHAREVQEAGDEALACATCHVREGGPRMAVEPLEAGEDCLSCHGHPAEDHLEDAPCATCHVPLASTSFPAARMAALPVPASHAQADFVLDVHGEVAEMEPARCATCHVQQRCLACHVDAGEAAIAAVPAAPASLGLPIFAAHYPVPPSHGEPGFQTGHGDAASAGACATCHTRQDCAACHLEPLPQAARALPARGEVAAPGVGLVVRMPESHRSPFFVRSHQALAASAPDACATCHTQAYCADCHDGSGPAVFHPEGFVQTHPSAAWGREMECANCHEVQVFCRACHVQVGFEAEGRLGRGYHDAQPLWLIRHGQAARQSLETCASCHEQAECLQCHSQTGSFRVSPHGAGFDAQRAWERSPGTCFACHLGRPPGVG